MPPYFILRRSFGLVLITMGLMLPLIYFSSTQNLTPIHDAQRLVPTAPLQNAGVVTITVTPRVTPTPPATISITRLAAPSNRTLYTTRARFGIGVPLPAPHIDRLIDLGAGWFLDWTYRASSGHPAGLEYVRVVSVPQGRPQIDLRVLANLARQQPGTLWLVGNEPDVIWQNNATPEQYVQAYYDVYTAIKGADPASRIAIGGVTQPTPLRLQYLDRVLALYQEKFDAEMPIDVWNVHNFILPETRGDWGAEIPPGLTADRGVTRTIDQHDDLALFKQQIIDFRRWMAGHGFRDKELIVTEYGVLMYADYGFPYERVRDFMRGTFDFFLTAADSDIGLAVDGDRLVQRWCWFSLADKVYPTGNLVDVTTGELTLLGKDFAAYIQAH